MLNRLDEDPALTLHIGNLIEEAEAYLRFAVRQEFHPGLLFARAVLQAKSNNLAAAAASIAEADTVIARAGIRIYIADAFLVRARLFKSKKALEEGRKLVEEWGYWRWRLELKVLNTLAEDWS